jgi:predicted ATPase/transcriptional regulator with XRE-family HTH domain/Tfp pilus assembly protein PilF
MAGEAIALGTWLRQRRREFGYTQDELARHVGCSAIAIRKMEADEYRPSQQIALKVAESLEVPADEWELFVRFARGDGAAAHGDEVDRQAPWRGMQQGQSHVNLPVPLTRLIGREEAVVEVCSFITKEGARLVTLTGPPGVGKTRLGIEVGAKLAERFEDGVYFVPLAPISEMDLVVPTISSVLKVRVGQGHTLEDSLRGYLRDKRVLLVLDNFEQVVDAAPQVEDLLRACAEVSAIVTSREALHLQGEQQFQVEPLALPQAVGGGRGAYLAAAAQNPAARLFVERARSVRPDFELREENVEAVAGICARLDGLPLAIEIAAARTKMLSTQSILARLDSRLSLVAGTARYGANARQQTLRGAIDWSYNLLDGAEQRLFRRLGVFTGGYTPAAVEAVCNATGDLGIGVLEGIESLLDKSLLRHEEGEGEEDRFTMLETLREYAAEMLRESGKDSEEVSQHHAEYYLALAEAAEPELRGTQQARWLGRLEREHGNLRTALRWTAEHDTNVAVRLVATLWWFWWLRGHISEGREWLREVLALERAEGEDMIWRARALRGAGWLAYAQGEYDAARVVLAEGLALFEEMGEKRGIASSLDNMGAVAFTTGDNDTARGLYERSLAIRKEMDDRRATATSLNNLGLVATAQGDYKGARPLLEESQALYRELKDDYGIATSLNNLGLATFREGNHEAALPILKESLAIRSAMGDKYAIAYSLVVFAAYAGRGGSDSEGARITARLLAATDALLQSIGARLENVYLAVYEQALAEARARLGESDFRHEWEGGSALNMAQAIEEAEAVA